MSSDVILKIKNFWKKHKVKIIIFLIVWAVIIIINTILKNMKIEIHPQTTYEPHTAIMDDSEVPKKLQNPIEDLISEYVDYCNKKEYEKAYNILSTDCKQSIYPTIDQFKEYIDKVYDEKKVYYIQNYSNVGDTYIYNLCLFEDMLATGLTGSQVEYYEEKCVVKNVNGNLELSIREYIGTENIQNVYEDEYIKISIEEMVQKYETQKYKVKITNRTEYPIVLADGTENKEILLGMKYEVRNMKNLPKGGIVIFSGESKTYDFEFTKFYDEKEEVTGLIFNAIRVLKSYSGKKELRQAEMDNAVSLYSITMEL